MALAHRVQRSRRSCHRSVRPSGGRPHSRMHGRERITSIVPAPPSLRGGLWDNPRQSHGRENDQSGGGNPHPPSKTHLMERMPRGVSRGQKGVSRMEAIPRTVKMECHPLIRHGPKDRHQRSRCTAQIVLCVPCLVHRRKHANRNGRIDV